MELHQSPYIMFHVHGRSGRLKMDYHGSMDHPCQSGITACRFESSSWIQTTAIRSLLACRRWPNTIFTPIVCYVIGLDDWILGLYCAITNLLVVVICPATGGSSILTVFIAVSKLTFCDIKHYQGSPVLAGTKQSSLFPIK